MVVFSMIESLLLMLMIDGSMKTSKQIALFLCRFFHGLCTFCKASTGYESESRLKSVIHEKHFLPANYIICDLSPYSLMLHIEF